MGISHRSRGLLPFVLAAALAFSLSPVPAGAEEELETTLPSVEMVPSVEPEETVPTEPEQTIPETTQPQTVSMTIAAALEATAGEEGIALRGTVVYADHGLTVLQDFSGGICLVFPEQDTPAAGQTIEAEGSRTPEGFRVESWTATGNGELPAAQVSLENPPECVRICLKDVAYGSGMLIQGEKSIYLTPSEPDGIISGDRLDVWGVVVRGHFYADTWTPVTLQEETQDLTVWAVPTGGVLLPGENVGLYCDAPGASIYYVYSYDGEFFSDDILYFGGIPVEGSQDTLYVRAYAQGEDGTIGSTREFYFEIAQESTQIPDTPETRPPAEEAQPWNLYFGQLHGHTDITEGAMSVSAADSFAAAKARGLDFFAVSDHSNSLDNHTKGSLQQDGREVSRQWAQGKDAAAAASDKTFVGIFGYEMAWQELREMGHISTFYTPGWQSREQEGFSSLESYYEVLTKEAQSISQFNHPGIASGHFEDFSYYHPRYDAVIHLLELGDGNDPYYYNRALNAGWHVAPTVNQVNRDGSWETDTGVRTVILAEKLEEQSLYEAMREHRVYATEDSDLQIWYYLNGSIMGSVLEVPAREITVTLSDPTDAVLGTLEVVVDGGNKIFTQELSGSEETLTIPVSEEDCAYFYYYLRLTQPDGDVAVTAPVWVDVARDMGIRSFTASSLSPTQGERVTLTVEFKNNEQEYFRIDAVEFYLDGQLLHRKENWGTLAGCSQGSCEYSFEYNARGPVEMRAVLKGSCQGIPRQFEVPLTLEYQAKEPETALSTVAYTRRGTEGNRYRVLGQVTLGNANPHNTLPGTIYVQDSTGGIAVTNVTDSGIGIDALMDVTGTLSMQDGNPVLQLVSCERAGSDDPLTPQSISASQAADYASWGGKLVQVQGEVLSLTRTADALGVARFTLKDSSGYQVEVSVGETILSGTSGVNSLTSVVKGGNQVKAIGIMVMERDGTPVVQVRDCDEVTYAASASRADPSNPKTGDQERTPGLQRLGIALYLLLSVMGVTSLGMAALFQLWKKRR